MRVHLMTFVSRQSARTKHERPATSSSRAATLAVASSASKSACPASRLSACNRLAKLLLMRVDRTTPLCTLRVSMRTSSALSAG